MALHVILIAFKRGQTAVRSTPHNSCCVHHPQQQQKQQPEAEATCHSTALAATQRKIPFTSAYRIFLTIFYKLHIRFLKHIEAFHISDIFHQIYHKTSSN